MKHRTLALLAALAVSALARPAAAQGQRSYEGWSILGAETLAPGQDAIYGAFGWPDLTLGYKHGVNPGFDAGVNFSFIYGVENTSNSHFGVGLAVPLRWALSRSGNAHLLLHVDPGLRVYTYDPALFGFTAPIGLNIEFLTRAPFKFGIGADFNMSLFVTGGSEPEFIFGPLIGPYFEYHVDRNLAVGVDTRFGAIIDAYSGGNGYGGGTVTKFGFRAQMMLAYRL